MVLEARVDKSDVIMNAKEAKRIYLKHIMDCGMLMPMDWVKANNDDSDFAAASEFIISLLDKEIANES